ncbi:MAG: hypothetical protein PQ612_06115 [Rickettsiales bacterium]|nr:hypothetical protein [Pseudomonadota bacterium]MDA0966546.1 hypothetical protein [Pseudomonadota bacterium]MDG4543575.1 hypothetical protein [Rickettsiales bacterium]MDG4545722.1 hypothetical protein [Rickettsiales bacterium]MDG4547505.1 hypothetical protein [Rickettsiales bacterium]
MSKEAKEPQLPLVPKKNAVFLSLANGAADWTQGYVASVAEHYDFNLLNKPNQHPGLENRSISAAPEAPFTLSHTHSDKERADQLIQFFNDPSIRIGFDTGGEGITGVLYWFNKYRENPEEYIAGRKAEGSKIDYFTPRPETKWITDNKILIVSSDSEELGPYFHSSGIANVIHATAKTPTHPAKEALKLALDALYNGGTYTMESKLEVVAGEPLAAVTSEIDVASSRMMANQDRTATGAFQKRQGHMSIIATELYSFQDSFIGGTSSLELMPDKLKAASVLIINDDYANPKDPKLQAANPSTIEQLSKKYPHLTICSANFAPSHGDRTAYSVGFPCLYGATTEIGVDGSYKMEIKSEALEARLVRNTEYHTFMEICSLAKERAPNTTEEALYKTSLVDYLKTWHGCTAVNLAGKDVVLDLDNIPKTAPWNNIDISSDNRNLGNLLLSGGLDGAKSISLNVNLENWWDEKTKAKYLDGKYGDAAKSFYTKYPTYDNYVMSPDSLFNSPHSPLVKRIAELQKDYGLKVRLTTEIGRKLVDVQEFAKLNTDISEEKSQSVTKLSEASQDSKIEIAHVKQKSATTPSYMAPTESWTNKINAPPDPKPFADTFRR